MDNLLTWWGLCIWAIMLLIQNASFTLVSRARNSSSKVFHGLAAIGSNGVWFITQLVTVGNFIQILKNSDWWLGLGLAVFYTFFTVVGSVTMHHISMKYFEKGKRSVGGFDWSKLTIEQKQEFCKLVIERNI